MSFPTVRNHQCNFTDCKFCTTNFLCRRYTDEVAAEGCLYAGLQSAMNDVETNFCKSLIHRVRLFYENDELDVDDLKELMGDMGIKGIEDE